MKILSTVSAAIAVAAYALVPGAVLAAPLPSGGAIGGPISSHVEQAQYRRYGDGGYYNRGYGGRGYYGRRRGNGVGIGLGIAGAVIVGSILAEEARRSGGSGSSRCARTYRSYDPDSGTYTGYDGETHRCPYL